MYFFSFFTRFNTFGKHILAIFAPLLLLSCCKYTEFNSNKTRVYGVIFRIFCAKNVTL
nr:MAG TPA: foot protein [Bacteriophage sp.]